MRTTRCIGGSRDACCWPAAEYWRSATAALLKLAAGVRARAAASLLGGPRVGCLGISSLAHTGTDSARTRAAASFLYPYSLRH